MEVVHTSNFFYSNFIQEIFGLTSYITTSKAVTMFEDDKRFKAVDLEVDREDLFRNYLVDLQKKVHKILLSFKVEYLLEAYVLLYLQIIEAIF